MTSIYLFSLFRWFFSVPYRDFFMSMAYMTGGQYVPMVNAKLLAKVIIGGVREEISLDRLMQSAEADIQQEISRAEAEGVDDTEKVHRIQHVLESKGLKAKKMSNMFGAASSFAKNFSKNASSMADARAAFSSAPTSTPFASAARPESMTYDLREEDVDEEQAERIYQKMSNKKKWNVDAENHHSKSDWKLSKMH